jgi:hypothetical protein
VAASSTASGASALIRRRIARLSSTWTETCVADAIWAGDGIAGFSITRIVVRHSGGIAARVAAAHFR